jgi:ribosomal-protein-alanine N-acetyltransferase
MPFGPLLIGPRVVLRPAADGDAEARRLLGRHADIARMFGAAQPSSGPMSSAAAQTWLERLGEPGTVEWVVDAEGQFLGTARLHSFREDGSARYAVGFFDPERLGRGFGTEVTAVVVEYAFGSLGLQRLDLAVLEFNERAIRCYKRCGFREAGRASDVVVIDGEPHHDVLMEITPAAFRNQA